MRSYEAMIILHPHASPERLQDGVTKVKDVITKQKGSVSSEIKWGKRTLAFPIKKKKEGYYLILEFQADPSAVKPLHQAYRLMEEDVLRVMILEKTKPEAKKAA